MRAAEVDDRGNYARLRPPVAGLIWTLVRTDFKTRYHGTLTGFTWALLKPLAMVLVLMGVFSFIFSAEPNYSMNLIIGLLLYDFFGDATKVGLISLRAKGYLLTKTKVPTWIIVATSASNALITLSVVYFVFVLVLTSAGRPPALVSVALLLLYVTLYLLIVLGISLATSVLFLEYRDLNQVWEVATQVGFFLAPVIYPLGVLPERVHLYLYLWPPTPIIQFSRLVLVDRQVPSLRAHLLLATGTAVILLAGALVFRWRAARAIEHL
jgi:lipopolysaccharide transport system permease protein